MLIGIDANEANLTPNRVGVNQYAFDLLHALYELKTSHSFVIYLKTLPQADLPVPRPGWTYRVIPFPKLWTQTRLPWDLYTHRPRPDVFFSMTHYAPRWSPVPTVVAIMDLGFLKTPEQFTKKDFNQLKSWTAYSVKNAAKIIAISEFTKKDILETYHRSSQDVVVTLLGYDKKLFKPTRDPKVLQKYKIIQPYFLFLGSLRPSKNIESLIRAFLRLKNNHQLVIAGKKGWLYEQIFSLVHDLKMQNRVVFTDFVEESEVPVLMTMSDSFVMPSFYEGFGIPVLEAMACGTPVVISKVTSLPEVAGEAGVYVDPNSVDSIVAGIKIATGPKRSEFVNKGLSRVKLFDWVVTAQATLKCLETATVNH